MIFFLCFAQWRSLSYGAPGKTVIWGPQWGDFLARTFFARQHFDGHFSFCVGPPFGRGPLENGQACHPTATRLALPPPPKEPSCSPMCTPFGGSADTQN